MYCLGRPVLRERTMRTKHARKGRRALKLQRFNASAVVRCSRQKRTTGKLSVSLPHTSLCTGRRDFCPERFQLPTVWPELHRRQLGLGFVGWGFPVSRGILPCWKAIVPFRVYFPGCRNRLGVSIGCHSQICRRALQPYNRQICVCWHSALAGARIRPIRA